MNNFFNSNDEDTSFERGNPISQAAKTTAKAINAQSQQQQKAFSDAIKKQLYGDQTATDQTSGVDESGNATPNATNPNASAVGQIPQQRRSPEETGEKSPEEQAKMEKVRRELFGNYAAKFKTAQNGPFGITTDVEQEMEKARQERKQKEEERKREQEEEERRKKEEEERQKAELGPITPPGKGGGRNKMQQPIALTQAKTKTEINRGTSG